MNAGPDIERLISDWLIEESPANAPDRILHQAARIIDRTKQRRFGAAWREPMSISAPRLIATAAVIIVAIVGAGWFGRSTAGVGQTSPSAPPLGTTASASPFPASIGTSLVEYRAARNAICTEGVRAKGQLSPRYARIFDPAAAASQRADGIDALDSFASLAEGVADQLAVLNVPTDLQSDHQANVTRYRDVAALIRYEIGLLRTGKLDEAQAVDKSIDTLIPAISLFEQENRLVGCP